MSQGGPKLLIHHDPQVVVYAVTPDELERLHQGGTSLSKDFFIACFSLGVPCAINAVSDFKAQKVSFEVVGNPPNEAVTKPNVKDEVRISASLLLNSLFACTAIILGLYFLAGWLRERKQSKDLLETIRAKPQQQAELGATDVGSLPLPGI